MNRLRVNSIRFKTSILFTAILCLILLVYSSVLFRTVEHILYRNLDSELRIKAEQVTAILNAYAQVREIEPRPSFLMRKLFAEINLEQNERAVIDELWKQNVKSLNLRQDFFQVLNAKGQAMLMSRKISRKFAEDMRKNLPREFRRVYLQNIDEDGNPRRIINYPFLYNAQVPMLIQLATPLEPVNSFLKEVLSFIAVSISLILVFTSFLGNFLTKSILKPVVTVIKSADSISHKDLSVRIKEKEMDEEMKALIDAFNTMLARMESSFTHINDFSSHVAHELKTPLAIIKGEIELALYESHEEEEYRRVMETVLQEIDRMIKITKDILLLAKLEYKPDIFNFEKRDIVVFLEELCEHARILATEKPIELTLRFPAQEVPVEYDPVNLRRLFFNLIHNAIKFTPQGGNIEVSLSVEGRYCCVSVADSGEGISEDDQAHIFEKFFRAGNRAADGEPGYGLGLAIAQSIARAHNGEILVSSRLKEGSTFTVMLPLAGN